MSRDLPGTDVQVSGPALPLLPRLERPRGNGARRARSVSPERRPSRSRRAEPALASRLVDRASTRRGAPPRFVRQSQPDGSPPRGPAVAGQAPSTLHRSARARAHASGDAIAHQAERLPPHRAPARAPPGDEGPSRPVHRDAGRRDPVGRQRPGRAVHLLGREGVRGVRHAGRGGGGQPQAHGRARPRRRPVDRGPREAVHQPGQGRRHRERPARGDGPRGLHGPPLRHARGPGPAAPRRGAGGRHLGPGARGRRPHRRPQRHAGRDHGPGRRERAFGGGHLGAGPVQAQGERHLAQEQRAGQEGRGHRQGQVPGRRRDPPPEREPTARSPPRSSARTTSGRPRWRSPTAATRSRSRPRTRRGTRTRRSSTCGRALAASPPA